MSAPADLPVLSHLQFLVLGALLSAEQPGRVIRQAITRFGANQSGAAFYQMMARLERDEMVEGWYEQILVADQYVTERRYRISGDGKRAWSAARNFYEYVSAAAVAQRLASA